VLGSRAPACSLEKEWRIGDPQPSSDGGESAVFLPATQSAAAYLESLRLMRTLHWAYHRYAEADLKAVGGQKTAHPATAYSGRVRATIESHTPPVEPDRPGVVCPLGVLRACRPGCLNGATE
jgi:hypothetical protein